jgi:hypothetical protein
MNSSNGPERLTQDRTDPARFEFWLCFVAVFIVILALHARPVPFANEYVYLPRLIPDFLPNDWTFSRPAYEHWFFNAIFSFPARFISIEAVGWLGRLAVWTVCLLGLFRLGRLWDISYRAIAVSIILWLAFPQAVINLEWIFGGFEAKTVAYACLLFSLYFFSNRFFVLPSILLGLSFSFHPAVGLWAIPASGVSLFVEGARTKDLAVVVVITALFSLPGAVPLALDPVGAISPSYDDWRHLVQIALPFHLDLFQFSKGQMLLLFAMLVFNVAAMWKSPVFALRLLAKFQAVLGVFFLLGIALRAAEMYPLLRFMPMRLLPVFTPVFFMFTGFHLIPKVDSVSSKLKLTAFAVAIVALQNPFVNSIPQLRQTVAAWRKSPTDLQKTYQWISENTEHDALILSPPFDKESWYLSRRAVVVSYRYVTQDRLPEWRERVVDLTDNAPLPDGLAVYTEVDAAFNRLSPEKIEELRQKYWADYLISQNAYSYPILFESGAYKVYRLGSM